MRSNNGQLTTDAFGTTSELDPSAFGTTPTEAKKPEGDYLRGLKKYAPQMQEMYGAGKALAGKAIDSESLIKSGIATMQDANRKVQEIGTKPTDEWTGVNSVGDAIDWAQHGLGQVTGNLAESAVAAGAGTLLGGLGANPLTAAAGGVTGLLGKSIVKGALKDQAEAIAAKYGAQEAEKFIAKEWRKTLPRKPLVGPLAKMWASQAWPGSTVSARLVLAHSRRPVMTRARSSLARSCRVRLGTQQRSSLATRSCSAACLAKVRTALLGKAPTHGQDGCRKHGDRCRKGNTG